MLYAAGSIGVLILGLYLYLQSRRADAVLSELNRKPRTEEDNLIAKTQQELEDAKIRYDRDRADLDEYTRTHPDLPKQ